MPPSKQDPSATRNARLSRIAVSMSVAMAVVAISILSTGQPANVPAAVARSDLQSAPAESLLIDEPWSWIADGRGRSDASTRGTLFSADAMASPLEIEELPLARSRAPSVTSTPESTPDDLAAVPESQSPATVNTGSPTPSVSATPMAPSVIAASDPRVGDDYILVTRARLVSLPMGGPAWAQLKAVADGNAGAPNLSDLEQDNNVKVLAQSLVYARTGDPYYRGTVLSNLKAVVGTEGARTLELARKGAAYVLAADFIDLERLDPDFDNATFRPWLRSLLTIQLDGRTLRSTHEERANNWGTHAGATRAAIAAYLRDHAELARTAQVFRGWLGERSAYAGFTFGDMEWQPDSSAPVAVLPVGAKIDGVSVDGALPEEMRRGGAFQWPPAATDYPWGALEGATLQAEILHRNGYDAYNWGDRALYRAVRFLFEDAQWRPAGNDQWVFWTLDYRYGTAYRSGAPVSPGKNFGWSDWLYGPGG